MIDYRIILFCVALFACLPARRALGQDAKETPAASLNFDGIDDHVLVPNHNELQLNRGTIEAWIKVGENDQNFWHAIVAKELAYQLTLLGYQVATYDWKTKEIQAHGPQLNDHAWHHVAFTFNDAQKNGSQLYVNGQAVGSPFTYHVLNQSSEVYVGTNRFNPQYFNGNIDEVRVWNRPLTGKEIRANYRHELKGYEKGLVLYLRFNQGIAGGNNEDKLKAENDALNLIEGQLQSFGLKEATSNFVSDSPVVSTSRNHFLYFINKNQIALIVMALLAIATYLIVRIRTNYLINQNKKLEEQVAQKTQHLLNALKEKETLVQEIHHRVKNNLQFIIALIELEKASTPSESGSSPLNDISRRLNAMALVHDILYTHDNLDMVDAEKYIKELILFMKNFSDTEQQNVQFSTELDTLVLNVKQCIPLGMILSELISNSLKHAFKHSKKGNIHIRLRKEHTCLLEYSDNGSGIEDIKNQKKGMGSRLIDVFSRQLNGKYTYASQNGLRFTLEFSI